MRNKDFFKDMPKSVQFVIAMGSINQPISHSAFEKALEEGPEYFPEEVEHRRKWDLVPQEVKDSYFKSCKCFPDKDELLEYEAILGERPHKHLVGGILHRCEHPELSEEYRVQDEWDTKMFAIMHKKENEEYNRLFSPYGITREL